MLWRGSQGPLCFFGTSAGETYRPWSVAAAVASRDRGQDRSLCLCLFSRLDFIDFVGSAGSVGSVGLPGDCVQHYSVNCVSNEPRESVRYLQASPCWPSIIMWLDRMSGHSTPSAPPFDSRGSSPIPRRSSHLSPVPQSNRPGSNRQGSSLSVLLTPNDSNTSLPATARGANGRTNTTKNRPSNVTDPFEVLKGIIGKRKGEIPDATASNAASISKTKPPRLVEAIDFGRLSLEGFIAKEDERGLRRITNSDAGAQTIEQFEKERDRFQDLHAAITGCDDVSKSVETYLSDFQSELGAVSAEIETLQTRSVQLNAMWANRRNVEQLLGPAVEEVSISPRSVRLIAEGPIDDNWVKALNEIETRTASIEAKAASSSYTKSIDDVRPLLNDLKNKVCILRVHMISGC